MGARSIKPAEGEKCIRGHLDWVLWGDGWYCKTCNAEYQLRRRKKMTKEQRIELRRKERSYRRSNKTYKKDVEGAL